jgi:hypothetical protein
MGIMTVDKFFKLGVMSRDSHDITNKSHRRSIKPLSFDEAENLYGFSNKDDLELKEIYIRKYKGVKS